MKEKEIYLAGGCFWGLEKYIGCIQGILFTEVGYANGNIEKPTYQEVCHGNTHFVETVRVVYDAEQLTLSQLLDYFYQVINPISLNKQGNDVGEQYRTGVCYKDKEDEKNIKNSIQLLQTNYTKPILIEVKPLDNYYAAEEYHQKYLEKNPNGYCHIPNRFLE